MYLCPYADMGDCGVVGEQETQAMSDNDSLDFLVGMARIEDDRAARNADSCNAREIASLCTCCLPKGHAGNHSCHCGDEFTPVGTVVAP